MDVKVPKLSESVTSGTVVKIFVSEGDKVKEGQDVVELETEKATAAIPAPQAGVVEKIYIKEGQEVKVGQPLLSISGSGGAVPSKSVQQTEPPQRSSQSSSGRVEAPARPVAEPAPAGTKSRFGAAASPSIRKMAHQLGIDLNLVPGTERGGRISMADLKAYLQKLQALAHQGAGAPERQPPAAKPELPALPDFSKWGEVEKKALTPLRKKIAEKMSESWRLLPHVTEFEDIDVTETLDLIKKHSDSYQKQGVKLTLTAVVVKALAEALKKHPAINASLDEAKGEIIYKKYFHIGIAVDTDQGLIVPVVRDVDKKNLLDLSKDIAALAEKTRQRKIALEDLEGGTFTISNLGGIGASYFTPIIKFPEAAILGIGRAAAKATVRSGKIESRMQMPMALSYDHRLIDGAVAARFVQELIQAIQNFGEEKLKIKAQK